MNEYALSICIPTYNRGYCLRDRLNELSQILSNPILQSRVEVVVCDNGSPDDTPEVAKSMLGKVPNLKYCRNQSNHGYDYNLANCILNSSGRYLWIFGDDDFFLPDCLEVLMPLIDSGKYDLIVGNQLLGDSYSCREVLGERMFPVAEAEIDTLYNLCNRFGFFRMLAFVSSLIFRRPSYQTMDYLRHLSYNSALMHTTIVFESLSRGNTIITAHPLLRVEPPQSHQTREHQLNQDPKVNFHTWSLNILAFLTEMIQRELIRRDTAPIFFEMSHCQVSVGQHVAGSFRTCIENLREVPDPSWETLLRFLRAIGDQTTERYTLELRRLHDHLFKETLRTNAPLKGQVSALVSALG